MNQLLLIYNMTYCHTMTFCPISY